MLLACNVTPKRRLEMPVLLNGGACYIGSAIVDFFTNIETKRRQLVLWVDHQLEDDRAIDRVTADNQATNFNIA